MNKPAKNLPGRPRNLQSHQAILQASLELLSEVGYERTSIDAIAVRAGVSKPTIYRRYKGKEELIASAIESFREEVIIPDTGRLWDDIDALIENAAQITLSPLGRQTVAMIISSASTSPQFAQIYWTKCLQPRRQAFAVVIERAKVRKEVHADLDPGLVFDTMSGIMLYAQIFQPQTEPWQVYVRRAIHLLIK
ncbi:TetR/AcrR family transcriptional regulator [Nostoc sp. 'Peltigera membranacea cyanobiont' N6]|uniref:TetR/AcrR family transcriptional regulator n=1 Tax=Nostoc sp. 'Peltigera membranacea cyanobiont' N6 TaxID=1261031 RepID=UPI000CF30F58|nr:TetR/AcrR family transcriptional regulator [Nostoc sp. 'Peltigera membranacea cyanobiont' N6]AVH68150.1 TetR family transcriptional regulator [Nostoc sp. 'Peltigera membranacea cyanobiont' N6]